MGHLIAMRDAPILDWRGLNVIAYWDQDLRGAEFGDRFSWFRAPPRAPFPTYTEKGEPEISACQPHRVQRMFSRGEVQVWQMLTEVKRDELEEVFRAPFRPAITGDPNDIRGINAAARRLLNATRTNISPETRHELQFLADRTAHQIEARKW